MTIQDQTRTWRTGDDLPREERRARNTSAVSENKIHEDDVARQYGFRGGLVPGATTCAYLASYLTRTLGVEWAAYGSASGVLPNPDIVRDQRRTPAVRLHDATHPQITVDVRAHHVRAAGDLDAVKP